MKTEVVLFTVASPLWTQFCTVQITVTYFLNE